LAYGIDGSGEGWLGLGGGLPTSGLVGRYDPAMVTLGLAGRQVWGWESGLANDRDGFDKGGLG